MASFSVDFSFSVEDDSFDVDSKLSGIATYLSQQSGETFTASDISLVEETGELVSLSISAANAAAASSAVEALQDVDELEKSIDVAPGAVTTVAAPTAVKAWVDGPSLPPPSPRSPLPANAAYIATVSFTLGITDSSRRRRLAEVRVLDISNAVDQELTERGFTKTRTVTANQVAGTYYDYDPSELREFEVKVKVLGDDAQAVHDHMTDDSFESDVSARLPGVDATISDVVVALTMVAPPSPSPPPPSPSPPTGTTDEVPDAITDNEDSISKEDEGGLSGTSVALIIIFVLVAVVLLLLIPFTLFMRKRNAEQIKKVKMETASASGEPVSQTQV